MQVEFMDESLGLATDGPLLVACWWDAPTPEQMREVSVLSAKRDRRLAGQTAYAQFVLAGTPKFGREVREIAERITRDHYALGIAHCIEMDGLTGAATRAFLGGLLLIRRGTKPMKVFAKSAEASDWIAGHLKTASEEAWTGARVLALRQALVDARAKEPPAP